jgi:hypothetical protein
MFTVIIPTMWKYPPFYQFLEDMLAVPSIGQIIIIDNDPEARPDLEILRYQGQNKIDLYSYGKNIYVNPAWNAGIKFAKFDRICLYGDDLIFDLKVFHRLIPHISPERGVFGICPGNIEMGQIPVTTGSIDIVHSPSMYHYKTQFGFGMLMFLHKSNWIDIPEGLDLYWGDNFIYDTQFFMMNQNYFITNLFHHTPFAVTSSQISEHNEMLIRENEVYNRVMPQLLNDLRVKNAYRTRFN